MTKAAPQMGGFGDLMRQLGIDKLLGRFGIDLDTAIVLFLVWLLAREKCDYKLILALLYILI